MEIISWKEYSTKLSIPEAVKEISNEKELRNKKNEAVAEKSELYIYQEQCLHQSNCITPI